MSFFTALRVADRALRLLALTEGAIALRDRVRPYAPEEDKEMSEEKQQRTIIEEIEVETQNLVEKLKDVLREGNVRTLRIKDAKGRYLLEIPLTVGVVAGGAVALMAPWIAALSALAGVVSNVKVEIVRNEDDGSSDDVGGL